MFIQPTIKLSTIAVAVAMSLGISTILPVYAGDYQGNVRVLLGQKSLESDDWASMDQQDAFGVIFDIKRKQWPVSIAIDVFGAGADSDSDDLTREHGYTVEQHFGVRKTWSFADSGFHPYAGGGLAVIHAGFEQRQSAGGAEQDDTAVGSWIGGGAYWNISQNINLGLDLRYSQAEVTVFDQKIEAGGVLAGLTLGYHW